jgi:hypothetical protein
MSFGKLALEFCDEQLPLQVLESGAGYYIGTCTAPGRREHIPSSMCLALFP